MYLIKWPVSVYLIYIIDHTPVEQVNSFKFLGVHITEDLTWSAHTDAVLKKTHQRLFFLRQLRKFGTSPRILRSFYTCTVESILTGCITAWFGNSTAGNCKALQRVVRTARHIVGGELPSLQDIYTRRCTRKARRIINDSSHPSHRLLSLLPRAGRYTGSYRIPVFIFLTIWILKIPQYRCHLNNVWNATLLERGLFSLLHFGEDIAVCVTKRESSETEALVECDEREVIHNTHIDRHKYPPSAASAPASLTN